MYVLNMQLNCRDSVSSPPHSGHLPEPSRSSARNRCLQALQSTSGSVKFCTWPDVSQTLRVHENRRVEADDVVARRDHLPPPRVLDVALELDPQRAVVPRARQPAVDLAGLKYEPALLAQVYDGLHINQCMQPRLCVPTCYSITEARILGIAETLNAMRR